MPNGSNRAKIDQAEIAEALNELGYPVFLNRIIIHAAERGTRDAALQILEKLPSREYLSKEDVLQEIAKIINE